MVDGDRPLSPDCDVEQTFKFCIAAHLWRNRCRVIAQMKTPFGCVVHSGERPAHRLVLDLALAEGSADKIGRKIASKMDVEVMPVSIESVPLDAEATAHLAASAIGCKHVFGINPAFSAGGISDNGMDAAAVLLEAEQLMAEASVATSLLQGAAKQRLNKGLWTRRHPAGRRITSDLHLEVIEVCRLRRQHRLPPASAPETAHLPSVPGNLLDRGLEFDRPEQLHRARRDPPRTGQWRCAGHALDQDERHSLPMEKQPCGKPD
jgi:hypothetical protein